MTRMKWFEEMSRHRSPRIWDTDWLILRPLAVLISAQAQRHIAPGWQVLDLGCGEMPYKSSFERLGARYIGADLGEKADLVIAADGRVPLPSSTVNAVLSSQVLEHVKDLGVYFSEVRRLLVSDGILLLSTHGTWLYHPHPGDYRRWTRTGLIAELDAHGFTVDEVFAIAGPLATTTLIRLTGYAFVLRKIPVIGTAIGKILALIMNLRALAEDAATPTSIKDNDACIYFARAHLKAEE